MPIKVNSLNSATGEGSLVQEILEINGVPVPSVGNTDSFRTRLAANITPRIVATQFAELDSVLYGGLLPGCVYLLAGAEPEVLTSMALQIAMQEMPHSGCRAGVSYYSTRLTTLHLETRLLSMQTGIPYSLLLAGNLEGDAEEKIDSVLAEMRNRKLSLMGGSLTADKFAGTTEGIVEEYAEQFDGGKFLLDHQSSGDLIIIDCLDSFGCDPQTSAQTLCEYAQITGVPILCTWDSPIDADSEYDRISTACLEKVITLEGYRDEPRRYMLCCDGMELGYYEYREDCLTLRELEAQY